LILVMHVINVFVLIFRHLDVAVSMFVSYCYKFAKGCLSNSSPTK